MKTPSILILTLLSTLTLAADISLPAPQKNGGKPLMNALADRKTDRNFADKEIPAQTLSDLLWAANGLNRAEESKHTAPTARNWQEVDIYVIMKGGAYLFNAKAHTLTTVNDADLRAISGFSPAANNAALTLVYVVDRQKQHTPNTDMANRMGAVACGFIGQNVYLFCASENLGTVFLGSLDATALTHSLQLDATRQPLFAQSIGYLSDK